MKLRSQCRACCFGIHARQRSGTRSVITLMDLFKGETDANPDRLGKIRVLIVGNSGNGVDSLTLTSAQDLAARVLLWLTEQRCRFNFAPEEHRGAHAPSAGCGKTTFAHYLAHGTPPASSHTTVGCNPLVKVRLSLCNKTGNIVLATDMRELIHALMCRSCCLFQTSAQA